MEILIDTNVFIYREDDEVLPRPLRELLRALNQQSHDILIHPLSKKEVQKDKNTERRKKVVSKIETYAVLKYPQYPRETDEEFRDYVGEATNINDRVDNALLFTVYTDAVDFLITEDKKLNKKARKLGLEDRVFKIEEARNYFSEETPEVRGPPSIQRVQVGDLDSDDPIFESLKEEYHGFRNWLLDKAERTAYISRNSSGSLGSVLILKPGEFENIGHYPPLGKEDRLKICTLKVAESNRGQKLGELLISIAIREAINHGLEEIYLTHHIEDPDYLVDLITDYGFSHDSDKIDGEAIFVKRLTPGLGDDPDPLEAAVEYYPTFYDGTEVKKFMVPIHPEFHDRLFPSYTKRQQKLFEFGGGFLSEGNAIRKAYLSHSPTRQITPGDLLLFYRTSPEQELTTIGVCESAKYEMTDPETIQRRVRRRTVYTDGEIEEMASKPTSVLLFQFHFHLDNPIGYEELLDSGVLSYSLQSIIEIEERDYKYIKTVGGLDERFTLD